MMCAPFTIQRNLIFDTAVRANSKLGASNMKTMVSQMGWNIDPKLCDSSLAARVHAFGIASLYRNDES